MMRGRSFGNPTYAPQRKIVPPPPPIHKVENVEQLPPGWTAHIDERSKMPYYHHSSTGVSSWTKPVVNAVQAPPPPPPPPPTAPPPPESEWTTHFDPTSKINYYYNINTGMDILTLDSTCLPEFSSLLILFPNSLLLFLRILRLSLLLVMISGVSQWIKPM